MYTDTKRLAENIKISSKNSNRINYIGPFILSMVLLVYMLYSTQLYNLVINYSFLISVILIFTLILRFLLNDTNRNSEFINAFVNTSLFLIMPLLLMFTVIILNKVFNIIKLS